MSVALPVPATVVEDLRGARRRHRVAAIHWIDALYQVYVTALALAAGVLALSTVIGDERLDAAAVADLRADGPAVLGVVAALAVAVGLRSGSRGGPLAVEAAEVRHVLLAPVDRGRALRTPARRQLRFALFAAAAVGAATGQFAGRRLPGAAGEWVAAGALYAVTVAGLGVGTALVASGRRLPRWVATAGAAGLVAWAVADVVVAEVPTSPASLAGGLALWPLDFRPVDLVAVAAAGALVACGLAGVAGVSLEEAERRTSLVGQLRFAVTLQDLRTVLVLRRQLALDLPRSRPWVPVLRAAGQARFPVWQRGWRGVLRWPAARLVRLSLLAVAAGFALRGVWNGTTPLAAVAGLTLWVAGLDAVEPLAQETDHPGRRDGYPQVEGALMVRHIPVPVTVMLVVAAVAVAVAAGPGEGAIPLEVAVAALVPLAFASAGGAIVSVIMGAPKPFDDLAFTAPEIAGARTAMRTVWPPLIAVLGAVPVAVARAVADGGRPASAGAGFGIVAAAIVLALTAGWVHARADIRAWFDGLAQQAAAGAGAGGDDDDGVRDR